MTLRLDGGLKSPDHPRTTHSVNAYFEIFRCNKAVFKWAESESSPQNTVLFQGVYLTQQYRGLSLDSQHDWRREMSRQCRDGEFLPYA